MPTNLRPPVRRSRKQWQSLIDEQQRSRLTQVVFCQQNKLAVSSFCNWKRRLSENTEDKQPAEGNTWLSLPEQLFSPSGNWKIELDLGDGICLRLNQG